MLAVLVIDDLFLVRAAGGAAGDQRSEQASEAAALPVMLFVFFLEVYSGDPRLAEEVLSTTFGIVGFAPVTVVPKELDAIAAEV